MRVGHELAQLGHIRCLQSAGCHLDAFIFGHDMTDALIDQGTQSAAMLFQFVDGHIAEGADFW